MLKFVINTNAELNEVGTGNPDLDSEICYSAVEALERVLRSELPTFTLETESSYRFWTGMSEWRKKRTYGVIYVRKGRVTPKLEALLWAANAAFDKALKEAKRSWGEE